MKLGGPVGMGSAASSNFMVNDERSMGGQQFSVNDRSGASQFQVNDRSDGSAAFKLTDARSIGQEQF